ncbi:cytidylate kinase-like family protein [Georgenia sp. EYE_87]|uniref:cytidylate kinase-like family protein n=1 Tax=Georgenia sp. EYE_87 TaxID=2853448 RepID=UPI0020065F3D|nr:cytidylate kinase-like family protein [Georgenia sp. EYE_87]MCK6211330.1 cytidylate kinase-like family protein [Georgenia sp. EYE_87]
MSSSDQSPVRPVVTLFETYGAGASYVGPRVAEALGLPFHQQAFSSEQLEAEEERREKESLLSRVFSAMGPGYAGPEGGAVPAAQRDSYELALENTRIVQEEAARGGVVMGRNGAVILAGRPATLHVLLDGPVEQRVARAARDTGISHERAARRQKREDEVRAQMSKDFYGWDPRRPDRYDMVLNTGSLSLDECVAIIVDAVHIRAGQVPGPAPAAAPQL